MKFLADMGISPKSVAFLRQLGHDVVHLHEQGLDQLADSAILAKARDEGRVVLTHDLDFPALIAAAGADLPSVVVFRLRNMDPDNVNRFLADVLARHSMRIDAGAIVSVTEAAVRVRPLPLRPGG